MATLKKPKSAYFLFADAQRAKIAAEVAAENGEDARPRLAAPHRGEGVLCQSLSAFAGELTCMTVQCLKVYRLIAVFLHKAIFHHVLRRVSFSNVPAPLAAGKANVAEVGRRIGAAWAGLTAEAKKVSVDQWSLMS